MRLQYFESIPNVSDSDSDDEQDRILWVQAMYRATGQSHKPVPPTQVQKLSDKGGKQGQVDAPISQFRKSSSLVCFNPKVEIENWILASLFGFY